VQTRLTNNLRGIPGQFLCLASLHLLLARNMHNEYHHFLIFSSRRTLLPKWRRLLNLCAVVLLVVVLSGGRAHVLWFCGNWSCTYVLSVLTETHERGSRIWRISLQFKTNNIQGCFAKGGPRIYIFLYTLATVESLSLVHNTLLNISL
jgi:hypothetical protein